MQARLSIDTLKFAKRLADAGLPREAAEAIVEGLNEADLSELATKTDVTGLRGELQTGLADVRGELQTGLADVRGELKTGLADVRGELQTGLADLRGELKSGLAELRADIYARLWVMGLGIVGLTVALIKLLPS